MTSVALLASLLAAAPAPTVEQCVAASETAQLQRQQGHLLAARRSLESCSDAACPAAVQSECTRWLDEVLSATPTVVVVVRLDGQDQAHAKVTLDGLPWVEELTGQPLPLEPGAHQVRAEAGGAVHEQTVVANVGEKNRLVVFQLSAPASAPVASGRRPLPWFASGLTGVTLLGVGLFSGLGLHGKSQLDALTKDACAATKTCNPWRSELIHRDFLAADVSLGVAVVAAVLAAWQWWRWLGAEPVAVAPEVVGSGAGVSLSGAW